MCSPSGYFVIYFGVNYNTLMKGCQVRKKSPVVVFLQKSLYNSFHRIPIKKDRIDFLVLMQAFLLALEAAYECLSRQPA